MSIYFPTTLSLTVRTTNISILMTVYNYGTQVVPRTLSTYCDRTFAATGPRLWNSLPVQLCAIQTSPTDCSDHSWSDNLFGKHEHGALSV